MGVSEQGQNGRLMEAHHVQSSIQGGRTVVVAHAARRARVPDPEWSGCLFECLVNLAFGLNAVPVALTAWGISCQSHMTPRFRGYKDWLLPHM